MWPDRVSNPGPLTNESGALPTALRGPATFRCNNSLREDCNYCETDPVEVDQRSKQAIYHKILSVDMYLWDLKGKQTIPSSSKAIYCFKSHQRLACQNQKLQMIVQMVYL